MSTPIWLFVFASFMAVGITLTALIVLDTVPAFETGPYEYPAQYLAMGLQAVGAAGAICLYIAKPLLRLFS